MCHVQIGVSCPWGALRATESSPGQLKLTGRDIGPMCPHLNDNLLLCWFYILGCMWHLLWGQDLRIPDLMVSLRPFFLEPKLRNVEGQVFLILIPSWGRRQKIHRLKSGVWGVSNWGVFSMLKKKNSTVQPSWLRPCEYKSARHLNFLKKF